MKTKTSILLFSRLLHVWTALVIGMGVAAAATATNWTRLAVMPFHNVAGDDALKPWQRAFPNRLSTSLTTAQPFRFDVPDLEEVVSALTNTGWQMENKVTTDLAERVAAALRCTTVVLGEFSRSDGLWNVKIRIVQPGSAEAEQTFQVEDRSTHELLLRLLQKICSTLGVTPSAAHVSLMRDYPVSDGTLEKLARLDAEQDETRQDYVHALRDILASEPNCYSARGRLARALYLSKKLDEALAEGKKLVQQAPGFCAGHLYIAYSLQGSGSEMDKQREEELLAALKAHPGCPGAIRFLFRRWANQERWEDIRRVGEEAHQALPTETSTSAYLALARTQLGDRKGVRALLEELDGTREQDVDVHAAIMIAASQTELGIMARELLWLQRRSTTNAAARRYVSEIDAALQIYPTGEWKPLSPPHTYTPEKLQAELQKRLTPEERGLAVSPIDVMEDIAATARELIRGVTNVEAKVALLFAHVAEQRLKADAVLKQSRTGANPQLACHYYASRLVALARAIEVPGWLVHVEVTSEKLSAYHDRAALIVGGRLLQSDPTWGLLWVSEAEDERIRILDDLQAIAHHLCQSDSVPKVRAGMKLDPEDVWTRLVSIARLANRNHLDEAEALLKSLPPESTNRWNYYLDRGIIDAKKGDYAASLRSLQKADQLGPNNASVKYNLGLVYGSLGNSQKAAEHLQKAMDLGAAQHISGNAQDMETQIKMLSVQAIPANVSLDSLRRRAAEGDIAARMALVNRLFKQGPEARNEALNLLRQTAETGDPDFQGFYARKLLLMRGSEAAEEAVGFFRKAASQGNATAQYDLGVLFYEGKLVQKDEVEASQWMHLAAQSGDKEARHMLKEMELFMDRTAFEAGRKKAAEFKPVTAATGN